MKRIMVFWLVLLLPVFVFATEYKSSDIKIKLDIDDSFIVITKDNLDNNSDLDKLNVTKDYMKKTMDNNNIYFDIVKSDLSYEILIVVPKTEPLFSDLDKATNEELSTLKETITKQTNDKMPIVYKNDYSFIVVDYHDNNGYYNINYYTVVDSRGYNIQLQKKGVITDDEKDDLREIIDSIVFEKEEKKEEDSKSFDYKTIIIGAILGTIAGIITYIIGVRISKKKKIK